MDTDVDAGTLSRWQVFTSVLRKKVFKAFESDRDEDSSTWKVRVRLERDTLDGGWVAICADLPGVVSQGDTQEEALQNIAEAVGEAVSVRISEHVPNLEPEDDAPNSTEYALSV